MALELIKDCWNGDPLERPKMIEVVDALTLTGDGENSEHDDEQSPGYAAIEEKITDEDHDDEDDHDDDDDKDTAKELRKSNEELERKNEGLESRAKELESKVRELEKLNEGLRQRHGATKGEAREEEQGEEK